MKPDKARCGSAPPPGVKERLAALAALCVPEPEADAHARLARERPVVSEPFEILVARRLHELHALCGLATYLQRKRG